MNQTDAKGIFDLKTEGMVQALCEEIKKLSAQGRTNMTYCPSTKALLKSVKAQLKAQGYWVRESMEAQLVDRKWVDEQYEKGNTYCYVNATDRYNGEQYHRRTLEIWWVKPGFWEYFF